MVFRYHGRSYTGRELRRVPTSNHCVPAARMNHFDCYDSLSAARAAYRQRTKSEGTAAAIPPPPDVTLINNDVGPWASIMLPRTDISRLSVYGWDDRADKVKAYNLGTIQLELYRQQYTVDLMRRILDGIYDIENNKLSSTIRNTQ